MLTQISPSPFLLQALVEILLLSGGTPYASFKHLAHAWGREKGFHMVLVNNVCERRGEVERKRRSDAGRTMTEAEKAAIRSKIKKVKTDKAAAAKEQEQESKDEEGGESIEEQAVSMAV
jgi:hypothetical protein